MARGEAKFWLNPMVHLDNSGFDARTLRELAEAVEQNATLIQRHGMNTSAKSVWFDDNSMWVELADGRTLGIPLAWLPRLLHATPEQRQKFELSVSGIHWDELDEDISVAGLLAGRGNGTRSTKIAGLPLFLGRFEGKGAARLFLAESRTWPDCENVGGDKGVRRTLLQQAESKAEEIILPEIRFLTPAELDSLRANAEELKKKFEQESWTTG
jgi:uncharacterized protein DUF2442